MEAIRGLHPPLKSSAIDSVDQLPAANLRPGDGGMSRAAQRQALLNDDSLISATAAIGTSSPITIAVIISQPSSL